MARTQARKPTNMGTQSAATQPLTMSTSPGENHVSKVGNAIRPTDPAMVTKPINLPCPGMPVIKNTKGQTLNARQINKK